MMLVKSLRCLISLLAVLWAASAWAQEVCYRWSITNPSPFMGNDGEVFTVSNGTIWRVSGSYEYLYAYYPMAILCPQSGIVIVDGKNINAVFVGKLAK
jgi:hypothetical protein